MIPQFVINDLVTQVGEKILPVRGPAVCSKARDLLKIRSPWAGLATNLERRSAGDAALATRTNHMRGDGGLLSILDMAASSKLPHRSVETSEPRLHDTAFAVSTNHWNLQTLRSSVRKDAQGTAEQEQLGDDVNRRQFQVALLEKCSFFADLILRQVRAGTDPSRQLLERDWSREKLKAVRVSPTPAGSKANVVPGQRPEPETPSSFLPTLWVEVGCRHMRTLISEKERP